MPVLTASFPKVYATVDLGLQGTSLRRHLRRLAHRLSRPPLSAPSAVPSVRRVSRVSPGVVRVRVSPAWVASVGTHTSFREIAQPASQRRRAGYTAWKIYERDLWSTCVCGVLIVSRLRFTSHGISLFPVLDGRRYRYAPVRPVHAPVLPWRGTLPPRYGQSRRMPRYARRRGS